MDQLLGDKIMTIVCNCPGKCEIHPKPRLVTTGAAPAAVQNPVPPDIDAMDKLTLKTLEAEFLKAQIEAQRQQQALIMRVQSANMQLEQFSAAMYDKYGVKQTAWQLDLAKLEFVPRPEPPKQ